MAAVSRAEAVWEGDLPSGKGRVKVASGTFNEFPVTWASRAERSQGTTSPEELLAAARKHLKDWNERVIGESPRWRGPRRNFCRVFSMIPFEAFTIALHPSSWTSSTSSSRTSHATSSRSARDGLVRPRSPWTHSFT